MSISKVRLKNQIEFEPIILPKKTIFQLCSLLENYDGEVKISNDKSKIKFELNNSVLISKLIDGKFPNYEAVIPKENPNVLEIDRNQLLNSTKRASIFSSKTTNQVKFYKKTNHSSMPYPNISATPNTSSIINVRNNKSILHTISLPEKLVAASLIAINSLPRNRNPSSNSFCSFLTTTPVFLSGLSFVSTVILFICFLRYRSYPYCTRLLP